MLFFIRTDAEAEALAKYVLALVKKPLSDKELEEICLDKLNVFLQNRNFFGINYAYLSVDFQTHKDLWIVCFSVYTNANIYLTVRVKKL